MVDSDEQAPRSESVAETTCLAVITNNHDDVDESPPPTITLVVSKRMDR